ncbi:MAG: flagellar motor protein MotB [Thiohalomonadaceae bacterium]
MTQADNNNSSGNGVPTPEDAYHLDADRLRAELEEARRTPLPWAQTHEVRHDSTYEDDNAWVFTYIDMLTLILTLFVLMLAYAKTDSEAYRELSEAVSQEMGRVVQPEAAPVSEEQALAEQFGQIIRQQGLSDKVEVLSHTGRIELRLKESILFATGRAELRPEGRTLLDSLVPLLRQDGHAITVEGHTDNVPIATEIFPSNWELSAARASHVVRHLISQGVAAQRLRAIGYADTRPLADNTSAAGRAVNRRVSLVLSLSATADPGGR